MLKRENISVTTQQVLDEGQTSGLIFDLMSR